MPRITRKSWRNVSSLVIIVSESSTSDKRICYQNLMSLRNPLETINVTMSIQTCVSANSALTGEHIPAIFEKRSLQNSYKNLQEMFPRYYIHNNYVFSQVEIQQHTSVLPVTWCIREEVSRIFVKWDRFLSSHTTYSLSLTNILLIVTHRNYGLNAQRSPRIPTNNWVGY